MLLAAGKQADKKVTSREYVGLDTYKVTYRASKYIVESRMMRCSAVILAINFSFKLVNDGYKEASCFTQNVYYFKIRANTADI